MNAKELIKFAHENEALMIDLKFVDLPGIWQHLTVPMSQLSEESLEEGFNFDGSSIKGWKSIDDSDMKMVPVLETAKMDPFTEVPTLSLICDIVNPDTFEPYNRDPRQVIKKALNYLKATGIADDAFFGPEAEFFIFDDVRFEQTERSAFYALDSDEAAWNSGRDENGANGAHKVKPKGGYFPVMPVDTHHDMRTEISLELEENGMEVERHHHEVATAGQGEINIKFDSMVPMADKMMLFKYIVKNVAYRNGKTATFMPKPIFGDNGSGMHTHISLWKNGKTLMAGDKYAGLSQEALYFIGGIIKHAPALCAFTNPTTNSYKRLVPGFEAPIKLAYSYKNRSAAIRIPNSGDSPSAKRIEFRTPDAAANPYLAFAALLMAGIDGIENKIEPGEPLDKDIYGLPPKIAAGIKSVPASLDEALKALESDQDFLKKGNVFDEDLLGAWLGMKWDDEVRALQLRPTPYEFELYYDC